MGQGCLGAWGARSAAAEGEAPAGLGASEGSEGSEEGSVDAEGLEGSVGGSVDAMGSAGLRGQPGIREGPRGRPRR